MNHYFAFAIPPLIASLGNLFLGGLVLGKKPNNRLYQIWALFSLCLAIWSFGFFMVYANPASKSAALMWNKFYSVGMVMIPIVYFHYVLILTKTKSRILWSICHAGYLLSVLIVVTVPTVLFNKDVTLLYWGYSPVRGITGRFYDILYPIIISVGALQLFRGLKTTFGHRRAQIKYAILASCVGFGLGITNFLPLYGVKMYPIGHIGNFVANMLVAYSIMKYSFMDINVFIRKSAVYTVLTGMVTAAYIGVVFIVQRVFQGMTGYTSVLPVIAMALVIAITIEPMRRNVQLIVDKTFFRKQYEYQKVIRKNSDGLRSLITPAEISAFLMKTVEETLHPKQAWLLAYNHQNDNFSIAGSIGGGISFPVSDKAANNIVEHMSGRTNPVWFDDQDEHILRRRIDRQARRHFERAGLNIICPLHGKAGLVGVLFLCDKRSAEVYTHNDAELIETLCGQAAASIENTRLYEDLQASYLNTVKSLVAALEAKDEYTKGHSERVAGYARAIAVEMNLSAKEAQLLYEVSLLHDVGKIGVSEQILNKKGKLTKAEFEHIQSHTVMGEKILSNVESIKDGLSAVRHHHEMLNGDGYPDGLSESSIPLTARILAVADAFDAMTTKRSYRDAMSTEEAISELKRHSCQQFDPYVVRAFISFLVDISKEHSLRNVLKLEAGKRGTSRLTA